MTTNWYDFKNSNYFYFDNNSNMYYSISYNDYNDEVFISSRFQKDYSIEEIFEIPEERLLYTNFMKKSIRPYEDAYIAVVDYKDDIVSTRILVTTPFSKDGYTCESKDITLDEFKDCIIANEYEKVASETYASKFCSSSINNDTFTSVAFKCGKRGLQFALTAYFNKSTNWETILYSDESQPYAFPEMFNHDCFCGMLTCRGQVKFYPIEVWDEISQYHKVFDFSIQKETVSINEIKSLFWRNFKNEYKPYCLMKDYYEKHLQRWIHTATRNYPELVSQDIFKSSNSVALQNKRQITSDLNKQLEKHISQYSIAFLSNSLVSNAMRKALKDAISCAFDNCIKINCN